MKILFIDDYPETKVQLAIDCLKYKKIEFDYVIVKCLIEAFRYLNQNSNEIDLVVLDLGLPLYSDGSDYSNLLGLEIVDEIKRLNITAPIIINSTTEIPNEDDYLNNLRERGITIEHVEFLTGKYLIEFLQRTNKIDN